MTVSGGPKRTDTQIDLPALQFHLHLARSAWTFDKLKRLIVVLRSKLEERGEEMLSVPSNAELCAHSGECISRSCSGSTGYWYAI